MLFQKKKLKTIYGLNKLYELNWIHKKIIYHSLCESSASFRLRLVGKELSLLGMHLVSAAHGRSEKAFRPKKSIWKSWPSRKGRMTNSDNRVAHFSNTFPFSALYFFPSNGRFMARNNDPWMLDMFTIKHFIGVWLMILIRNVSSFREEFRDKVLIRSAS